MTNEEMEILFQQGLEKIAAETETKRDPNKWKKNFGYGFGALGALQGGAAARAAGLGAPGVIGGALASGAISGGLNAATLGVAGDYLSHRGEQNRRQLAALENLQKTASAYGLDPEEMEYLLEQGLEKIAAETTDPEFEESLVKVASHLGMDPEYMAEALVSHRDELIKVAEVEEYISTLNDDEVDELLKEAAANDSELAAIIASTEQEQENEELAKLAEMVDDLTDEEAEQLLASIQEKKEG